MNIGSCGAGGAPADRLLGSRAFAACTCAAALLVLIHLACTPKVSFADGAAKKGGTVAVRVRCIGAPGERPLIRHSIGLRPVDLIAETWSVTSLDGDGRATLSILDDGEYHIAILTPNFILDDKWMEIKRAPLGALGGPIRLKGGIRHADVELLYEARHCLLISPPDRWIDAPAVLRNGNGEVWVFAAGTESRLRRGVLGDEFLGEGICLLGHSQQELVDVVVWINPAEEDLVGGTATMRGIRPGGAVVVPTFEPGRTVNVKLEQPTFGRVRAAEVQLRNSVGLNVVESPVGQFTFRNVPQHDVKLMLWTLRGTDILEWHVQLPPGGDLNIAADLRVLPYKVVPLR